MLGLVHAALTEAYSSRMIPRSPAISIPNDRRDISLRPNLRWMYNLVLINEPSGLDLLFPMLHEPRTRSSLSDLPVSF